jgi:hypothetical protein
MYKIAPLILFFSLCNVTFADSIHCLDLERRQNRLTFFYNKKDPQDKPYFYVKVLTADQKTSLNFDRIQSLKNHLSHISPSQYEIPQNAKKLYIIKSSAKLTTFAYSSQVIPSKGKTKYRGASNHPKLLPREKRSSEPNYLENVLNICEFTL